MSFRSGRNNRVVITEDDVNSLVNSSKVYVTFILVMALLVSISLFVLMLSSFYTLIAAYNVLVWSSSHIFFTLIAWFATRGYGCSADMTCRMGSSKIVGFMIACALLIAISALYVVLWIVDLVNYGCAGIPSCAGLPIQWYIVNIIVIAIGVFEFASVIAAWLLKRNIEDTCLKDLCLVGDQLTKSELTQELVNRGIDEHHFKYTLLKLQKNYDDTDEPIKTFSKKKRKNVNNTSYAGADESDYI